MMPLSFLHPGLLLVLLALPLIFRLLRIIPPAARKIVLPTTRLLLDLEQKDPPVRKIPWWLLLLRLAIPALLIIGFAGPVLNPQKPLAGTGPVTLIVDNGWAAAQTWSDQQQTALTVLRQAQRANRPVAILLTAPLVGEDRIEHLPARSPDEAAAQLRGLVPVSWPGRPDLAAKALSAEEKEQTLVWISSGLAETGYADLLDAAKQMDVFIPPASRRPMILRPPLEENGSALARVEAVTGVPATSVQVSSTDRQGRLLDQLSARVTGGHGYIDIPYVTTPDKNAPVPAAIRLEGRSGAGAVLVTGRGQGNRRIGLAGTSAKEENYNLTDPAYYLSRAVQPFATLTTGPIDDLIAGDAGMIILADNDTLSPATLETLEEWIKTGGILLRFASPALSENPDTLTPVPLLRSERSLQGSLTWETPLSIKSINPQSPLAGLKVPGDLKIRRQLLAEPSPDLAPRLWVTLSDETPLVSAAAMEKGLLVLVHATATPDWSDLPLSGFYVDLLRTLSALAGKSDKSGVTTRILRPMQILDGYGQLVPPPAALKPLNREDFSRLTPSSLTPPGLYGAEEETVALNLGDRLAPLEPLAPHVAAERLHDGSAQAERNLSPSFFTAALGLLLADGIILLLLSGGLVRLQKWLKISLLLLPLLLPALPTQAADDAALAGEIHLAYIRTGNPQIDDISRAGLETLSEYLRTRTAVRAGNVQGLTPGHDELSFYPLLYWPVSVAQPAPDKNAARALQTYIDQGGMILIDTREGIVRPGSLVVSAQMAHLQTLLDGITFNPLIEAPERHVIFKSFYLLNLYPQTSLAGHIFLEDDAAEENGKVSAILLSGDDWARHWAAKDQGDRFEQSIRFGINAVMYALTGNYKADQVHMNAILERLGRE